MGTNPEQASAETSAKRRETMRTRAQVSARISPTSIDLRIRGGLGVQACALGHVTVGASSIVDWGVPKRVVVGHGFAHFRGQHEGRRYVSW
jgi:hypothetical protein